ncbi:hypothetical protein C479_13083 [Halovivax asiaticus JCM 14624]|uniref:RnhA operon protein n=1 Tax=Halovivax asiaticus JCM 14624 TaxID=1227490 RepID=M0BF38_9EURY|nr:hypothetical protein [Halovivax asiaticus]ELZ08274.1 hypothetical protein C479_13083 [Halovivax asiaticus JCM 14624]
MDDPTSDRFDQPRDRSDPALDRSDSASDQSDVSTSGSAHTDVSGHEAAGGSDEDGLPSSVVEEAERLTRLARNATDPDERAASLDRRDSIVAAHDYTARVREEDETLVCHPDEWVVDGTVRFDRIDDRSAAVEVSLSGPGDPDDWAAVDDANRELVERVRERAGDVHAANVDRFADFMGNHCAKRMTAASSAEIEQFFGEYYPRNTWPEPDERAVVAESIERLFDVAGESPPPFSRPE